ncbi:unnamed protein product [Cuscuta europaea]|uniref:Exocyst subunit Exo70 family protein n=1 Tax=Cuscuta europaea TaxID=41803 RepID=A0A9P1E5D6_CUSEU|nr:unnamed protein product [Cuscuta europaea]
MNPSRKNISNNESNRSSSPISRLFITSSIKRTNSDSQCHDDNCSLDISIDNIDEIYHDVDEFIDVLSAGDRSANPPNVPDIVEQLCKAVESRIKKYVSCENQNKFGNVTEKDVFFIEAIMRLSKLNNVFDEFSTSLTASSWTNRIGIVLQQAMAFMEEEVSCLLDCSRNYNNSTTHKSFSLNSKGEDISPSGLESVQGENYAIYSSEIVSLISRICIAMITAGYENEFCQAYTISRRNSFSEKMKKFDFERINVEDVQRMPWDTLEGEIMRWMGVVKFCSETFLPGERRLADSIFFECPSLSQSISSNLARPMVIQLMDLPDAVSMMKRSAEKLFKFLDMYETIRDLISTINDLCFDDSLNEVKYEMVVVSDRIGETTVSLFLDLEESIKNDVSRTPVPGGAVHPLTRYVMNYLEYTFEYKDTLEHIFKQHAKPKCQVCEEKILPSGAEVVIGNNYGNDNHHHHHNSNNNDDSNNNNSENSSICCTTPFSIQIVTVMGLLDTNLKTRAMLYRDLSLRDIFLMNNGRYVLQKVKRCNKMHELMGDDWCRKRSGIVRQYHKSYQRETWGRVLRILRHDGLQVNGKIAKHVLREKFKSFTNAFDEIHRTQSTWVVTDDQLQSELRISISSMVIPAYRSFFGRFKQCLENSKQAEKYIKYQPEDIEALIEELFEGNSISMVRRRI